jgi:large subunit ribosomal protein L22
MQATARLLHYRGSAQKVRLVADLIRMKPVGRAVATLKMTRKSCSSDLLKLVESAIANAQQNESGVDADALVISKIMVDGAGRKPLQRNAMIRSVSNYKKRFARPRFMSGPQGRMWLVPRPFCHVTVVLSDDPEARKAAGLPAEAPKPVVKRRGGRVAQAVSKAGARPGKVEKAPKAAGPEKAAAAPKAETKKESKPKAAPTAEAKAKAPKAAKPEPTEGQES